MIYLPETVFRLWIARSDGGQTEFKNVSNNFTTHADWRSHVCTDHEHSAWQWRLRVRIV